MSRALLACALALPGLLWTGGAAGAHPGLRVNGPVELVSESNLLGCRNPDGTPAGNDHPDLPARAFRDHTGQVHLLAGSRQNFQWTGPTLDKVARRTCDRTIVSNANPQPNAFDHYQWLMAAYTEDGKRVYGLTHHEYHGELYASECKVPRDRDGPAWEKRCWYASVNRVDSNDGGTTFAPPGGKPQPIAMLPYRFATDMNRAGIHAPTNIVRHPTDGAYYVMAHASPYRDQARGMCVLRATDLEKGDWRAWGGKAFDVQFANPYTTTISDPRRHVCTPVVPWLARSLTYNTRARAFLLIGNMEDRVIYSWSTDLVRWSEPATLMNAAVYSTAVRNRAPEAAAYFSALDPSSPSRSFDQTDGQFYLYYTRFSNAVERGKRGWSYRTRQLVRQPVVVQ